jgi:putative membrane-bound dehydrogenase-like protein
MIRRLYPFVLAFLLSLSFDATAQVPPEKAVSTFQVVDGLEIALWASEPLFVNPTCMDIDHKGRVWVCESVNYRHKLHRRPPNRPAGDRIVILEDTKGTGKADKATTFYQSPELLAPLGIAVAADPRGHGYKVFVCQSPNILVFEDKGGDGKADGPPKKLLSGFGGFDHDHGVHGILIGPDGKLYFSVGDTGVHGLQSSDGKGRKWYSNDTDCRAGTIWRCDLDGTHLELIAHNFRNEYEPCVDSFGTLFVSDNDDDGNQQTRICYVMPGGDYGYHPRGPGESHWHEEQPGVVPKILRTYFGSPTGICVYEGTLLPKKYWGQLLHTDAGPRHIRCYHLTPKGAGYDVDREDMVTSTDNWFRPSDIGVAPDGSVFVADWYDPGVGGHGMGDTTRGRIYRITPKGHKGYKIPTFDFETKKGLTEALASPNLAVRYMAIDALKSSDWSKVDEVLDDALNQTENPWLRARAFWLSGRALAHNARAWGFFLLAMKDKDPRMRALALRWIQDSGTSVALSDDAHQRDSVTDIGRMGLNEPERLFALSPDETTATRREMLLTLRDVPPEKAKKAILELAKKYDGKDRFYLEAIGIAVGHHDVKRREIILADFDTQFPDWNDKVADLIWELRPPQVLPRLEVQLVNSHLLASQRSRVVDILAATKDPEAGKTLLRVLQSELPQEVRSRIMVQLKQFLPAKWRTLQSSPELAQAIDLYLNQKEFQTSALDLIAAAQKKDAIPRVKDLAADEKQPVQLRLAAIRTLGQIPSAEAVAALDTLTAAKGPLAADAVEALGAQIPMWQEGPGTKAALKRLQNLVLDIKTEPGLRFTAASTLAGSRPGTFWLLDLHKRKQLPQALVSEVGRLLRNSPHQDLRNRAMIDFPPAGRLDPKRLPDIANLAVRKGDAVHGQKLVAASLKSDLQCLKCHTILGQGGNVGPDLSAIGKKASRENLLESILYPSKAVADQYLTWTIETKQGLIVTGLKMEDSATHVTLRDANAKDTRIAKTEIETQNKSQVSLMPADLLRYMTEDDLVDMVEYLLTLKTERRD